MVDGSGIYIYWDSGVGMRALDRGSVVANWLSGVGDRAVVGGSVVANVEGGARCVERCGERCR